MLRLFVVFTLALALIACPAEEDEEPEVQPGQEQEEPDEPEETPEEAQEAEEVLEPDEETDEEGRYAVEFENAYTYEADGLTLEITGIAFSSFDWLAAEVPDVEDFLEDEQVEAFVVMEMTVNNDTGLDVSFFPGQGQIVIDGEQIEADLWFSDEPGGGPIRDGVTNDGTVVWASQQPFDDLVGVESLRYTAGEPFDDDSFESIGDEVDLEVEWEAR